MKTSRKKTALALIIAVFMCQTAFAVTDSTTFDDITFTYSLSGGANSASAYCIYHQTDSSVNITTNLTAYEFKTSNPLTVKTVTGSASRPANNSAPAMVTKYPDTGYEFYRAHGSYKVVGSNGSLTKTLDLSL